MTDSESPDTTRSPLLGDPDTWADAPDVWDEVMVTIDGSPSPRRRAVWVAAAAAVVVLVVAFVGFGRSQPDQADFVLAGTAVAPAATADVRIVETPAGFVYRLAVEGLDPAPADTYYEGWVVSDDGWVSVGTFHMRGGDGSVTLWSGVDPEAYPRLVVTLQPEGSGPAPSDVVVLDGSE